MRAFESFGGIVLSILAASSSLGSSRARAASGPDTLGTPPNDVCAGAQEIPACGPFPFRVLDIDLSSATGAGDPKVSCGKDASPAGGVWFSFTPASSGTYTITTCEGQPPETCPEAIVAVYRSPHSACPQGAQIGCDKSDTRTVRLDLDAHKRVFILVFGVGPAPATNVDLSILRVPDPLLENGGFETGDLSGWTTTADADATSAPRDPQDPRISCFLPDMPSEGCYMACLSTGNLFGGGSAGGMRTDLTSEEILFLARPDRIEVEFNADYQTSEDAEAVTTNDSFQARLVTPVGTFVILHVDTFGAVTTGGGLNVENSDGQRIGAVTLVPTESGPGSVCTFTGLRTKRLKVRWTKTLDPGIKTQIGTGPVYIEFSVSNQGDTENTSILCVDDVRIKGRKLD